MIIKHGRCILGEIHLMRKGLWAFFSWLYFSGADWLSRQAVVTWLFIAKPNHTEISYWQVLQTDEKVWSSYPTTLCICTNSEKAENIGRPVFQNKSTCLSNCRRQSNVFPMDIGRLEGEADNQSWKAIILQTLDG